MMAFNPFRAIGNAIKGAVDAVRGAFGGGKPPQAPTPPTPEKAPTPAPAPPRQAPTPPTPAPSRPTSSPPPRMPKFAATPSTRAYEEKDRITFGADSSFERDLNEAVASFVSERGGTSGLSADARDWLSHSSITQIFDNYWTSGGFTANQVLDGMVNISNIKITERGDGGIEIEFDYDSEIDDGDYTVNGHCSASA